MIEKIYHERWWNYSDVKWNLGGYVCLPASILWGALGFFAVTVGNRLLLDLFGVCPLVVMRVILWVIAGLLLADVLFSLIPIFYNGEGVELVKEADGKFTEMSKRMRHWITMRMTKRIRKAYPKSEKIEKVEKRTDVFAYGCGFYKVVLLFFIGSFLGDIVETILSPESRCVDEPKQCRLGTIQHRMGTCHRSDYGNVCPLQRPKRRISLYTWCISRGCV